MGECRKTPTHEHDTLVTSQKTVAESAPHRVGKTVIERMAGLIRIIASKGSSPYKEQIVPLELFEWHDAEEYGGWITLDEISARLQKLGFSRVFYVWEDTPLRGTIYQFGNYDPEEWREYGSTHGYA